MINSNDLATLIGSSCLDENGEKVGSIGQVYINTDTKEPIWASVKTGLFGMSETFVPIDGATQQVEGIRVPYTKDFIKDAPRVDADGALEHDQEDELYAYYGNGVAGRAQTGVDATAGNVNTNLSADGEMIRSEERLRVDTEKVETGRARLHKYVVTEEQTVTVPVTREEVRLEREPILDGDASGATSDIGEEEQGVVLTEERVVVTKETVPVERVSLGTETITEDEQVTEQVRKEKVEFDNDATGAARDDRH